MAQGQDIWFYDFHYIWAAAFTFSKGQDPYVLSSYQQALLASNWPANEAVPPFPHPPWCLPVYLPFGLVSYQVGLIFWLLTMVLCGALCLLLLKKLTNNFGGVHPAKILFGLLLFPPTYSTLLGGQVNLLLLLGVLQLASCWKERPAKALLYGSLTLVKPHLFVPLCLWSAVRLLREGRPKYLFIPIIAPVFSSLAAELIAPGTWSSFLVSLEQTAALHKSLPGASASQVIYALSGYEFGWVWILIFASLISVALGFSHVNSASHDTLLVLPLSVLSTPYIWAHTFVVLAYPYTVVLTKVALTGERVYIFLIGALGLLGIADFIRPWSYAWTLSWLPILILTASVFDSFKTRQAPIRPSS